MKKSFKQINIIAIAILFLFNACKNNKLNELLINKHENESLNISKIDYSRINKILINDSTYNTYHYATLWNDSILFALNHYTTNKIEIFNLVQNKHIKTIQIQRSLLKNRFINHFFIHNIDSIFIFTGTTNKNILLINSNGNIKSIWRKNDFSRTQKGYLPSFEYAISSSNRNMHLSNNRFYFILEPNGYDEEGDPEVNRHGIYNLETKKWEGFYGSYNGVLKEKKDKIYHREQHVSFQLILKNICYITYPIDHRVYAFDLNNLKFIYKKEIGSSHIDKFPKPFAKSILRKRKNGLNKFYSETPYYGPLNYHKSVDKFSRFCRYKNKNGGYLKTIIIFNENFDLEGEQFIDINQHSFLFETPDGYISTPNQNYLNSTDTCIFQKLIIKPNINL